MTMRGPVVLTAAMVAGATGGRIVDGDPSTVFVGVSTDTRVMAAGMLFVALRGDRFDAHDFLAQAVRGGATGILIAGEGQAVPGAVAIIVSDTLVALQDLARAVRRASGARVVAITGSAGKTTTKEVTADLLASTGLRVHRNRGNLNNHIGLPLSLVELAAGFDIAVVELGMNHAGEIRTLVSIAEPDIRVWTNVGDAHVGHFGSREAVADAKAEILEQGGATSVVVANADDPLVMSRVGRSSMRRISFGEAAGSDVRATDVVDRGFDGVAARIVTHSDAIDVTVPLPGRVHLSNVLAAVAVALECGVGLQAMPPALTRLRPVARRGASVTLRSGVRLVDDSYNASPAALDAAVAALAATRVTGRRIVIVGEMLELGASAATLHEACGRVMALAGVSVLVAIGGPVMDRLAAGAIAAGLPVASVHRFASSAEAARAVGPMVVAGDVVLVKGSRGSRTDVVVDHLMAVA